MKLDKYLITAIIFLSLIVVQIGVGIYLTCDPSLGGLVYSHGKLLDGLDDKWGKAVHGGEQDRMEWDELQDEYKCCGLDGPSDFSSQELPVSCCPAEYQTACFPRVAYSACRNHETSYRKRVVRIIGITLIIFAFVEMLLLGFCYREINRLENK